LELYPLPLPDALPIWPNLRHTAVFRGRASRQHGLAVLVIGHSCKSRALVVPVVIVGCGHGAAMAALLPQGRQPHNPVRLMKIERSEEHTSELQSLTNL